MEIKVTVSLATEDRKLLKALTEGLHCPKISVDGKILEGCIGVDLPAPNTNDKTVVSIVKSPKKTKTKPIAVKEFSEEDLDAMDGPAEDLDLEDEEEPIEKIEDFEDELEEVEEPEYISSEQHAQLTKALNTHKNKHGKAVTLKLLQKYAKQSDKIKSGDFTKVMKELKV